MKDLIDHIKDNCTAIDREARFDQMLDDCYSFEDVGGPFAHMVPSQVLKEMDPTAYRCGVNDYMDGEDTYEVDGETYDPREVDEARDEFVSDLEAELSDMQEDLESQDVDDSGWTEQYHQQQNLQDQINTLEERINQAKSYQF